MKMFSPLICFSFLFVLADSKNSVSDKKADNNNKSLSVGFVSKTDAFYPFDDNDVDNNVDKLNLNNRQALSDDIYNYLLPSSNNNNNIDPFNYPSNLNTNTLNYPSNLNTNSFNYPSNQNNNPNRNPLNYPSNVNTNPLKFPSDFDRNPLKYPNDFNNYSPTNVDATSG